VFPNPQDVLPLPPHPSIEQYRKLAKDLVKAHRSGEPQAIGAWADHWVQSLASTRGRTSASRVEREMDRMAGQVEDFATRTLAGRESGGLASAQFIIARAHGFESWPRFAAHLDRLAHGGSDVAMFEAAVDAIVDGDEATLRHLLATHSGLIRARSTREHQATLLHHVSANGVENYRQRTPQNIVAIARLLLDAGAELEAVAEVYGGGSTTLGLVATSAHPRIAGLQLALIELLLERGARTEQRGIAGRDHGIVFACLANGCPEAAQYLADRVEPLSIVETAGVGRLEGVKAFFDSKGVPKAGLTTEEIHTAFRYACFYGRDDVVEYLIGRGVDLAGHSGDGQTGLHYAGMGASLGAVRILLRHGAPLEALNEYGGTVLGQTLWSAAHDRKPDRFGPVLETLIAAGARLGPRHPPVSPDIDALLARHGSVADESLSWQGEKGRGARG